MKFRTLRIVFSAVCCVALLLVVALWIGSFGKKHRKLGVADIGWTSENGVLMMWSPRGIVYDEEQERPSRNNTLLTPQEPVVLEWTVDILGLHFFGPGSVWILDVPYWLIALPLCALAAAPWIKWSHRFSLRALLIATTVVAAILGLAVYVGRK